MRGTYIVYPPKMKYVALYPPCLGIFTAWNSVSPALASAFKSYIVKRHI